MSDKTTISAESFAGTWRLVEAYAETEAGRQPFPLGDDARGMIIYDAAGYMSAQLMSAGRERFSSPDLGKVALQEFKDAYLGYTSYYGTFSLDVAAGTVTHYVEGSLAAGWAGGEQLRYFEFRDDQLILKTPPMRAADGTKLVNTLVWARA